MNMSIVDSQSHALNSPSRSVERSGWSHLTLSENLFPKLHAGIALLGRAWFEMYEKRSGSQSEWMHPVLEKTDLVCASSALSQFLFSFSFYLTMEPCHLQRTAQYILGMLPLPTHRQGWQWTYTESQLSEPLCWTTLRQHHRHYHHESTVLRTMLSRKRVPPLCLLPSECSAATAAAQT
jgi:hypothetical protein